jgi:predicted ArsR family transcriptional regulator
VRSRLERLVAAGAVGAATAQRLLGRARRVFGADRSEERLRRECGGATELRRL